MAISENKACYSLNVPFLCSAICNCLPFWGQLEKKKKITNNQYPVATNFVTVLWLNVCKCNATVQKIMHNHASCLISAIRWLSIATVYTRYYCTRYFCYGSTRQNDILFHFVTNLSAYILCIWHLHQLITQWQWVFGQCIWLTSTLHIDHSIIHPIGSTDQQSPQYYLWYLLLLNLSIAWLLSKEQS